MFSWISGILPTITRVGALSAKIGGIAATAFGIRQIWCNANEQQSWQAKAMLSSLYALHMGSITLTTAVLLGATDVSAPVATAIVCSTALIKNIADLIIEKNNCNSLEKKHSNLRLKHTVDDKEFSFNLILIEDRKETEELVAQLEVKLNDSSGLRNEIIKLRAFKKKETLECLNKIRENLLQRNNEILRKYAIVKSYFSDIDIESFDVISAIQKLLCKSKNLSELQNSQAVDENIQEKLFKNSILQVQCIKYKKWHKIRSEITQQLLLLTAPDNVVERDYLHKRMKEISLKIEMLCEGKGDVDFPQKHLQKMIVGKLPRTLKKNLLSYLKSEIDFLHLKLTEQQALLAEKHRFVGEPINIIPLVDQIVDLTSTSKELSLKRLNEKVKSKHVDLGAASAGLALILVLAPSPIVSKALNPVMLSIGWIAGIASLYDLYKKYQTTHKVSQSQSICVKQFWVDKRFAIAQTNHADLRASLNQQIDTLLTTREASSDRLAFVPPAILFNQSRLLEDSIQPNQPVTRAKSNSKLLL